MDLQHVTTSDNNVHSTETLQKDDKKDQAICL